jgi:hypothetical protein
LAYADLVVPVHLCFCAEVAKIMIQVPSETVVVINENYH